MTAQGADGPVRWDKPVLTVHVADEAAWAGTDVAASVAQWAPAMALVLTDDAAADIVLTHEGGTVEKLTGATAYRHMDGSTITACTIALPAKHHGVDNTAILTHELGHCLGIVGHLNGTTGSVMNWTAFGPGFSETVTDADLDAVRSLYR